MNNFFKILLISFLLTSCVSKGYYPEVKSVQKASSYLWTDTEKPWADYNSFNRVKELVEVKKADVNYINKYDTYKTTPFLNASGVLANLMFKDKYRSGEIDSMEMEAIKIVKYLAQKGANIHALDINKRNGLHLAAKGGQTSMIPVLVDLGLNINLQDNTVAKLTPLILAIVSGNLTTVKAIVKAGGNINVYTARGNSPLDWAKGCASGDPENYLYQDQQAIVEYLTLKGAKQGKNDFTNWVEF